MTSVEELTCARCGDDAFVGVEASDGVSDAAVAVVSVGESDVFHLGRGLAAVLHQGGGAVGMAGDEFGPHAARVD